MAIHSLKLKKFYKRNKSRATQFGAIFNQTSTGLLVMEHLWVTLFLTPALIATSFISKDVIIMAANMLLALGYVSNFIYRVFHRDVSTAELLITTICITALTVVSIYFAPALGLVGTLAILAKVNLIATSLNGFFLARNFLIPPLKKGFDTICRKLGIQSKREYYQQSPLTRKENGHIIRNLLTTHYSNDEEPLNNYDEKLSRFNKLIQILCRYMNKYHEKPFGSVKRAKEISELESRIDDLVLLGDATKAISFIKRKINYKREKIAQLESAKKISTEEESKDAPDYEKLKPFFSNIDAQKSSSLFFKSATELLTNEISRQQQKIIDLDSSLPQVNH